MPTVMSGPNRGSFFAGSSSPSSSPRSVQAPQPMKAMPAPRRIQNSGSAITYEGKSDAALPVTTRVTYYLNGVETAPDDLAGQSGRVRIRFDYTNHTRETVTVDGQEYAVSVPFTAITAVILLAGRADGVRRRGAPRRRGGAAWSP